MRKKRITEQFEFDFSGSAPGAVPFELPKPGYWHWRITYAYDGQESDMPLTADSFTSCDRRPAEMTFEFQTRYPGAIVLKAQLIGRVKN